MSADIEKLAVFDSRIVQTRPRYAVYKGALSLTNSPFNAISATPSQHTYNIYVPSENVFVDRGMEWSSTVAMRMDVTLSQAPVVGQSLVVAGRDFSLCAFPLNSLCSTLSATINDTTAVINSNDVLKEVLRLTDYKKNRLQRTCPTMLDKYQNYTDAAGAVNNPLAGYENSSDYAEVPNGSFPGLRFTLADGSAPVTVGNVLALGYGFVDNQPVASAETLIAWNLNPNAVFTVYFQWTSTEKLVLSPFVFSDCHEWDTGLFGINNIQLIMNLQTPNRLIRSCPAYGRNIPVASIGYNTNVSNAYTNSQVNVTFLTPSLDVPLPPKSVVPYMEFPRYITQYSGSPIQPGATQQLISQTITLPQIPDLFIIYALPSASSYGTDGLGVPLPFPQSYDADFRMPLASRLDGVNNPLTVNFDNFSGLLSSVTTEQLYAMSVKNGLDMDYATWSGQAHGVRASPNATINGAYGGGAVPTQGSLLVLKPSQDVTLQTGQAPSLVGNFTFQFSLTVKNTSSNPQTPRLFVITANSGFFESIRGSSRIIKGVLSEQDIISAPLAPEGTTSMLQRMVGAGIGGALANAMSKARAVMSPSAPAVGAGKSSGGAMSAGAMGMGMSGGRKGIQSRLM